MKRKFRFQVNLCHLLKYYFHYGLSNCRSNGNNVWHYLKTAHDQGLGNHNCFCNETKMEDIDNSNSDFKAAYEELEKIGKSYCVLRIDNESYMGVFSTKDMPLYKREDVDSLFDGTLYYYVAGPLRVSRFNTYLKDGTVFNSKSCSIVHLEDKKISLLKNNQISELENDEICSLFDMGFISFNNEIKLIEYQRKKKAVSSLRNTLNLTILTTTSCNARCFYCYEKGIKCHHLNNERCDQIIAFVRDRKAQKVNVTWFGGEPLMNTDAITYLINLFIKNDISLVSSMVTNGYLVDKYIDVIKKANVRNVQITLDGLSDTYNKIKNFVYKDLNPFDKVVSNIQLLLDNNIKVAIRLNYDENNYTEIIKVIEFLSKRFSNGNLRVYSAPIFDSQAVVTSKSKGTCISLEVFKALLNNGFVNKITDYLPRPKVLSCGVQSPDTFVIQPNGNVYKCEHCFLENYPSPIFSLDNLSLTNDEQIKFWGDLSYPYPKCKRCKILPMCQGGCKFDMITKGNSCNYVLKIYKDVVEYYARKKSDEDNRK